MRSVSCLLLLLCTGTLALAQQAPEPAATAVPAPVVAARFSRADSVDALHRYFSRKRNRGTVLTVAAMAAPAGAVVSANRQTDGLAKGLTYIILLPMASAIPIGSFIYHRQYTPAKEANAVQALESGQLPASLRRRLKPRYFRVH